MMSTSIQNLRLKSTFLNLMTENLEMPERDNSRRNILTAVKRL